MRTALDLPTSSLSEHAWRACGAVRTLGWFHTEQPDDEAGPGFSYTTGFWLTAHAAEVIAHFLPAGMAGPVFADLYGELKEGRELRLAAPVYNVIQDFPVYFFPVAKKWYPALMGWSRWFYGGDTFPCLQMVWPDKAGIFPWEPGCDPMFAPWQPDLTEHGWQAQWG